jgi:hypothetical protein
MIKYIVMLLLIPSIAIAGAKTYGSKKDYTRQQKIQRGDIIPPSMTTCRLAKIIQSRSGQQACIYKGGNKTYELMFDQNCPKQYKCVYNPNSKEPNIDNVMDSLNSIGKK